MKGIIASLLVVITLITTSCASKSTVSTINDSSNNFDSSNLTSSDLIEKINDLETQVSQIQEDSSKETSLENIDDTVPYDEFEKTCQKILNEVLISVYDCSLEDNKKSNQINIDAYYNGRFNYVSGIECFGISSNIADDNTPTMDLTIQKYNNIDKFNEMCEDHKNRADKINNASTVIPEDQLPEEYKMPRAFTIEKYPYYIFVNCLGKTEDIKKIILNSINI